MRAKLALATALAAAAWAPQHEFERRHGVVKDARARVAIELKRSIDFFDERSDKAEAEDLVAELLKSPKLRDVAVLHLFNRTFVTRQFLKLPKNEGLVVALASVTRRGHFLPNVAWAHLEEASGGSKGRCPAGSRIPTTVIAKGTGYDQCGILIPNPYFPNRHRHLKMGDLSRWHRQRLSIKQKAIETPLSTRTKTAFWRGKCLAGSYLHQKTYLVGPPRFTTAAGRRARPGVRLKEAPVVSSSPTSEPCFVRRGAGARARLLAAALTARRPDLFDAKCQVLAPPRNFSCVPHHESLALHSALDAVTLSKDKVSDASWVEPAEMTRNSYALNLPGGTTGSYSRNLNHLWALGSVVLLWNSSSVEWYYPALVNGETHLSVDGATAIPEVEALSNDPDRLTKLSKNAAVVDETFVCADCIASYYREALRKIRDRTAQRLFLDDSRNIALLAKSIDGACEAFVEVVVGEARRHAIEWYRGNQRVPNRGPGTVKKIRETREWTLVRPGPSLCASLDALSLPSVDDVALPWSAATEYDRLHALSLQKAPELLDLSRPDRGTLRRRVDLELLRSLDAYDGPLLPSQAGSLVRFALADARDSVLLVLFGRVFGTRKVLKQHAGLVKLFQSSGTVTNVLISVDAEQDRIPAVVFSKNKYTDKGVLCPNPSLGGQKRLGDIQLWRRKLDHLRKAGMRRPLDRRRARLFWRGPCVCEDKHAALSLKRSVVDANCLNCGDPGTGRDDATRFRYALRLDGTYASGSYQAWAAGGIVLMWASPHREWYDPALRDRDTHLVVDEQTAPKVLAALNSNPARQLRLAEGAAKVRRSLVCPDCIADYVRRLAEAVRLHIGGDAVLDDAAFLRNLVAGVPGACDAFVDETGGSLCAFLATSPKAPREAEGDDDDGGNFTAPAAVDPVDLVPDEVWDAELEEVLLGE